MASIKVPFRSPGTVTEANVRTRPNFTGIILPEMDASFGCTQMLFVWGVWQGIRRRKKGKPRI